MNPFAEKIPSSCLSILNKTEGKGAVYAFCKELREIAQGILNTETKSMQRLSKEEQKAYDNAKYCHICKNVFGKHKNHKKVRDHDHYTGKFRGAAHSI